MTINELQKQEDTYLKNIIWLWDRYEAVCQNIMDADTTHGLEHWENELQHLYEVHIPSAYHDYYVYFGEHCTYQPKLSYLA